MLIKDKDILAAKDDNDAQEITQAPARRGISKENMSEAWGDAFDYYLRGITAKYLQFRGRATRLEFWGFAAVSSILYIPLYLLAQFTDMLLLPYYYALATLIPSFAVMARRLHDTNRRSAVYLAVTAVLMVFVFLNPMYAFIPALGWVVVMVRLLSKPTDEAEELYGEANEDDEIYGSDNEPIIAKFRLLAVMMFGIWIIATGVLFDNWSREALQKGTINQIYEDVEAMAQKENLSPEDVVKAQSAMRAILKQLQGQAISEKKRQELIEQAVKSIKNMPTPQ
ncbi:MAG: DUF805 domain-containing protein [Acetobacter sp.]|nr:DUF805 domain-containing protein [Acetobacter sp.]